MPTGAGKAGVLVHAPTTVCAPSGSYRHMRAMSVPSTRPASAVTAANTCSGGAARATSVATRRSAACSSANPRSSSAHVETVRSIARIIRPGQLLIDTGEPGVQ